MSRRFTSAGAAAAASAAVLALVGTALPAAAATLSPAAVGTAVPADAAVIGSPQLSVAVADDFPRVLSYTDRASGNQLSGSTKPVTEVTLNGTAHAVKLKAAPEVTDTTARYTLTFPDLPGIEIDASLSVSGRATTFKVMAVRDTEAFRVGTIDIPGHDLVSVGSTDAGAATAFTRLDPDSTRTADVFAKVTADSAADKAPVGASYAIVNTGSLAAAIESNSSYDKPSGATGGDDARFWHQARKADDGSVRVGVWSGQWTYRGAGAPEPESGADLPWAKVVVTPDANGDKTVDWQDGAVAFRTIGVIAPGSGDTADRVVTHIPFNFASQATHPFLRTLDDVKRVSLSTDGLGQMAILKGYASEGHDSAHPDYGGNYNKRAGGLKDLNTLLKDGKKWGAAFGVHVNATEAYAEANAFDEKLVDKTRPGWNWLGQSYYIDQRGDINSGNLARRFQQLRNETDPNLSMLYIDVYYSHGWVADKTLQSVQKQGWNVATEWADKFERGSLWSHWANDLDYGGATNKGLNSQIIRFIRNSEKDVWNNNPVLGQTAIDEFEGWTGETDWNAFYDNIWQRNLPAKYLQHQKITRWDGNDITFTGGVRGTVEDGKRTFYDHGRKVLSGTDYLLPWDGGKKLYHYSKSGGTSSWTVPSAGKYTVYKLTDNGRVRTGTVTPVDGTITLTATAGQPYVLYPDHAPAAADPKWGEGTPVDDPGFNDNGLDAWSKTGMAARDTDGRGRNSARLSGTGTAALSQSITGLEPGKRYTASALIEVEPGKTRHTTLTAGGKSVAVDRSTIKDNVAASDWHGTYFQRAKVNFTAPASGRTTFRIGAAGGSAATVRADDVRIVADAPATKKNTVVYEDFEDVDQGWGPFLKGDAGGSTDPRTVISQLHAPYTQAGWNGKLVDDVIGGKESLKAHEENGGLVYRTAPWTVPMADGHRYKVEYDYQSSHAGAYEWVDGYDRITADGTPDSVETRTTAIGQQRTTGHFSETVTAGCGDTWIGLRKRDDAPDGADFVLDGFTVTDLGAAPAGEMAACGTLSVDPAAETLEPGVAGVVEASFTNYEATPVTGVSVSLTVPDGWKAEPVGAVAFDSVAAGAKVTAGWRVTPPVDATYQTYQLSSEVSYTVGGAKRTLGAQTSVRTLPPPPTTDSWASDLDWTAVSNGWGPVERDLSNGETGAGDGSPLTIGGTVYAKGLGSHAPAKIRYYLGGKCTSFTAEVGVDDVQRSAGSVQFGVTADGAEKVKSPVLRAADTAWSLTADVTGAKYVELVVGDGGDGNGNDHADWGNARFHCGS
ncbi:endo-alpha-N-acetylgalactosaminidase family protein [Streptomyces sp. NBC_00841]|uniref:endo-alpha-N-acetylgalactosaminidase family protein n=1 Tax=unclassified Streptomyces TaxID=2593676 RepID=UPI00225290CB|nr:MULTISPECIES: endo-alpha-N-acetylgalactosaminidase family protein [unclassified Streptomyces]MCX4532402.1 endo-alpha-N-acetylgalactosaminidase family protein [Streptomyces sp. NBC_01669]WSA02105.1 endo-alpha-N-acetylgalactosaminidase family protein [Streptomyces sp. NBC_00841]